MAQSKVETAFLTLPSMGDGWLITTPLHLQESHQHAYAYWLGQPCASEQSLAMIGPAITLHDEQKQTLLQQVLKVYWYLHQLAN